MIGQVLPYPLYKLLVFRVFFGLQSECVEEFFLSGGPSSSTAVRVVVVHDIKEEESERQKEVQEDKGDEEMESEVDGEVGERVTQRAHETWR